MTKIDGIRLLLEESAQLVQTSGRGPILVVTDPRDARKPDADTVRGVYPLIRKLGPRDFPYWLFLFPDIRNDN